MSALIEEVVVFDVHCPDCSTLPVAQFDSRSDAEEAANDHDMEWHSPVFDDELVEA